MRVLIVPLTAGLSVALALVAGAAPQTAATTKGTAAPKQTTASKSMVSKQAATSKPTSKQLSQKAAPSAKPAPSKPATSKVATSKSGASKSGAKSAKYKSAKPPVVARQQQPSSSRYKEIQEALASRGYFAGEPDGNWGPTSIDALKRFQRDQNLVDDGKIGSLSLIALGLGPKRETAPVAPALDSQTQAKTP